MTAEPVDVQDAVAAVKAAHGALKGHDEHRPDLVAVRAEAIKAARVNHTLREIAEALGVSQQRIRQMEEGK